MRKLSSNASSYDRLDRLRRLKYGERRIRELITNPGGDTLIRYMTTTKGGKTLGRQLSRTPGGKNFNKRTDRIYTGDQLLKRLKQSHEAEVARRNKDGQAPAKPSV